MAKKKDKEKDKKTKKEKLKDGEKPMASAREEKIIDESELGDEEIIDESELDEDEFIFDEQEEILEEEDAVVIESEYTKEILKAPAPVVEKQYSEQEFKEALTAFFQKHRKSKLKHVDQMALQFKGKELMVLDYLHFKYVKRVEAIIAGQRPPKRWVFGGGTTTTTNDHNAYLESATAPKKGGKKMLLIVLLVVVVLGGVAAFFMLSGDKKHDATEVEHDANATEQTTAEQAAAIESVLDGEANLSETILADSTKGEVVAPMDSTLVE